MAANPPAPELVTTDRLDAALAELRAEINAQMHSMEVRLIKWQITSVAGIVGIGVAFLKLTA